MKATFENTVNILVKAYMNDTLQHCNCYACAVGNLIAGSKGINFKKEQYEDASGFYIFWDLPESDKMPKWISAVDLGKVANERFWREGVLEEINQTGYTIKQIAEIEYAFEYAGDPDDEDEDGFNGLMRVVDYLADLHNVDLSVRESAKAMFVKETL